MIYNMIDIKTLSIKEYLDKIKSYLKDTINNLKKFNRRQIQLTIAIDFLSSKDTDKKRVVHSSNDNNKR